MIVFRHIIKRNIFNVSKSNLLKAHLNRIDKDITSTVYRGTLFELQTLTSLECAAGMRLQHVGGKSDGGIDLRGTWFNNTKIIVQCKNTKSGCTPDHVRQLMGATVLSNKKTIGILSTISHKHFTRDVLAHFNSSPIPLGLATVQDTALKTLMFNTKAQALLKGLVISNEFDSQGNESLYIHIPSSDCRTTNNE